MEAYIRLAQADRAKVHGVTLVLGKGRGFAADQRVFGRAIGLDPEPVEMVAEELLERRKDFVETGGRG
jgi:hypothetical protein